MSYLRFGLMILTSAVAMLILMYLNTYAWEHVFFSETRTYMAILMGATMAVIMLAFMLSMYSDTRRNLAIFIGSAIVFALSLWLVRSQATVSGSSYMRAMIPHHSIAIMTSERSQIRDPRVKKLAHDIILAQQREIAEMRYLIGEVSEGRVVETIYEDPPAEEGTVEEALSNTLISTLDPSPMSAADADALIGRESRCAFLRTAESDPVLWVSTDTGEGGMKLNGVLIELEGSGDVETIDEDPMRLAAPGVTMTVRRLGDAASWRSDAELVFALERGLTVGYRGFWTCSPRGPG